MTVEITYQNIRDALENAVRDRGRNYIYPALTSPAGARLCRYWHDGSNSPGCIIGYIFYQFGATREQLKACENSGAVTVMERLEQDGWSLKETRRIENLLCDVQAAQDAGANWRYAIDNAIRLEVLDREARNARAKVL